MNKKNHIISLEFIEELAKAQNFIALLLHKCNVNSEICKEIHVVIDELCINVFSYNDAGVRLDIEVNISYNEITLLFIDNGIPFNILEYNSEKVLDLLIENEKIGGLGIYLVKHFADKLEYEYYDNKNHLSFYKLFI